MLNFVEEMEQLLDFMPIAIAMQEFVENKIVINNAARKLLNVQGFDLAAFRRDISSMRPGMNQLTFGKLSLSVRCALISFRERMGKICILTDVSEQVSIREREQIYKACLDSITDMNLFACDAEGTIILYNSASSKSDNIKSEDVFGRNMYEVFGPESDTAIRRALSTGEPVLDERGEAVFETRQTEFDNSDFCVLGDITVHQDGTCTVKMGKETDEEKLLMLLYGGEV